MSKYGLTFIFYRDIIYPTDNPHKGADENEYKYNQSAKKIVLCFACSRKSNFNFFEANFYQKLKKAELLFNTHRNDKRLITVAQIDWTPCRRFADIFLFHPLILCDRWVKVLSLVSFKIFHINLLLKHYKIKNVRTVYNFLKRRHNIDKC